MAYRMKRSLSLMLTFLVVISAFLAYLPEPAWAANIHKTTKDKFHDIVYQFTPKTTEKTQSTPVGFTPDDDYYHKIYRNDKSDKVAYVLMLDTSGSKSSVGAGVRYTNVGKFQGKPLDLFVEIADYSGYVKGKKLETATKGKYLDAKPIVIFRRKKLSNSVMCMEDVKFRYTFYESGTDTPIQSIDGKQLQGHVTYQDIDGGQGITFGSNFGDVVYLDQNVEGKKWFRTSGDTITQDKSGRKGLTNVCESGKKYSWVTADFTGNSYEIVYHTDIENGSSSIYDTDGDGKINKGEGTGNGLCLFNFFPGYVDNGIEVGDLPELEKKVGDVGFENGFDSTDPHTDMESAYEIGGLMGTGQFQYTLQQETYGGDYEKFVLSDTLKDCLTPVKDKITVTRDDGSGSNVDVSDEFDIKVSGQKVTATAKASLLSDAENFNDMRYRLNIVVKRNRSQPMEKDEGDKHYVSNKGSCTIKLADQDARTQESDPAVWAVYSGSDTASLDTVKVVGSAGEPFGSMDPHDNKQDAYEINGYNEFDYAVQVSVTGAPTSFVIKDTLEACLDIANTDKVKITDKDGKLVNSKFDIKISEAGNGQKTVEAAATDEALSDADAFVAAAPYVCRLTVHRKTGQDIRTSMKEWLDADGFTFRVPNKASIYTISGGSEQIQETNESWVTDTVDSQIKIEKTCVPYDDWEVGDEVEYAVKVSQVLQDGYAVDITAIDDTLPHALKLVKDSIRVTDTNIADGSIANVEPYGDNGWKATCPRLQYGEYFVVSFRALAGQDVNGRDTINTARAKAANDPQGWVSDSAEAWVNTAELSIDKIMDKYEHEVGDEVQYTVVVNNTADYTVAKNVVVSDITLPEGLKLKDGEDSVQAYTDDTVQWPVADGTESIATKSLDNKVEVSKKKNTWTVKSRYLSSDMALVIEFACIAEESVNGTESQNQVSVVADNVTKDGEGSPVPSWDDAKVYVNTVDLTIDKSASKYEWEINDEVQYRIAVSNKESKEGTIARNVVIKDIEIPEGLKLESLDHVKVNGVPAAITDKVMGPEDVTDQLDEEAYNSTEQKENPYQLQSSGSGFTLSIPNLPQGSEVVIEFPCMATKVAEDDTGWEWINKASVDADNQRDHETKEDDAEIYINTANLVFDKSLTNEYYKKGQDGYDNREAYEFRVGETVKYTLTLENRQKNSIARNVLVKDVTLPEGFTLGDVAVTGYQEKWNDPVAGTADTANQLDQNHYRETKQRDFTYQVDRYEDEETGRHGFTVTIPNLPATVADKLNPEWTEPVKVTYTCVPQEEVNGCKIINTAYASADNAAEKSDNEIIWVNSPDLTVDKSVDLEKYRVGDVITYNVTVTQDHYGCVARNMYFVDELLTPGVKLQKDSIVLMDENGRVIDDDDYEAEIYNDHFTLRTGEHLVNEEHYKLYDLDKYPEAQDGGAKNPIGIETQQKLTLEYQAIVTDMDLAGGTIQNRVTANSDEDISDKDEEEVPVNGPILNIEKTSDKERYHVGDIGIYKLTVTQLRENLTAKNVQISDKLDTAGAKILEDSLVIELNNDRFEPRSLTFDEDGTGFMIDSGIDITDGDKIEVVYQVLFESPSLDGKMVTNAAIAKGDNTEEEKQENTVKVEDRNPSLAVEKTSDKQEYKVGDTGHYTVVVTQTEKGATARNVIIKDQLKVDGARIVKDSIVIKNDNGRVMDDAEIQYSDGRYAIYTGRDLEYKESFTVTYDVVFEAEALAGSEIRNIARATCDNIKVETKEPDPVDLGNGLVVQKTSDPATGSLVMNGDTITYSIIIRNNSNQDMKNVLVKDPLPDYMAYVESQEQEGVICGTLELSGRVNATFIIEHLAAGEEKTVSFLAAVTDAPEDEMIVNVAQVRRTKFDVEDMNEDTWTHKDFRNTNETVHYLDTRWVMDDHTVTIDSGKLSVEKESDKLNYAVGETGHYTVTVKQRVKGAIATNVVVADEIEQKGAAIQADTIHAYLIRDGKETELAGAQVTSDDHSYMVETYANLQYGEVIVVRYDVLFQEAGEAQGVQVKNTATARDDTTPEGEEPTDDNRVTVGDAALIIEKTSDKQVYRVGETGSYQLRVYLSDKSRTVENVVVKDVMEHRGAHLVTGTVRVYLDGDEIRVKVDERDNGFVVETGRSLSGAQEMVVKYDVVFEDASLNGADVKNIATAWGDNVPPSDDDHTIQVGGKPEPTPEPDHPTPTPDHPTPENPTPTPEDPSPGADSGDLILTKTVGGNDETDETFVFVVTLKDVKGNALGGSYPYDGVKSGMLQNGGELILRHGESITIHGLPNGAQYTIEEQTPEGYTVSSIGQKGIIAAGKTVIASFLNEKDPLPPDEGVGDLTVTKTVNGEGDADREFIFRLDLLDAQGNILAGDFAYVGSRAGTIQSGKTFTMRHGDTITIRGLPNGAQYVLTEQPSDGYTVSSAGEKGTIVKDTVKLASFINTYGAQGTQPEPEDAQPQFNKDSDCSTAGVGDTVTYTLTAAGVPGMETVKNVVLCDKLDTEGAKIDKDSFTASIDGKRFQWRSLEVTDSGFTMETGKDLDPDTEIKVTYQVSMNDPSLAGADVVNRAQVLGDDLEPLEDTAKVHVAEPDKPALSMEKTSNVTTANVGDTVKYTLTVKEVTKGQTAEDVVIRDRLDADGISADDVVVTLDGRKLDVQADVSGNELSVKTGTDLAYGETLMVTYSVKFNEESLKGKKVRNTAVVSASDVPETSDSVTVDVPDTSKTSPTPSAAPGSPSGKDAQTPTYGSTGKSADAAKTGDERPFKMVAMLAVLAGIGLLAGLTVYGGDNKRRKKK